MVVLLLVGLAGFSILVLLSGVLRLSFKISIIINF